MDNYYENTAIAPILQYDVDRFSPTVITNGSAFYERQAEYMIRDTAMEKRAATVGVHALFAHHAVASIAKQAIQSMPEEEAAFRRILKATDDKLAEIIRNVGRE